MRGKAWTEEEQMILEETLKDMSINDVAKMLGRPYTTVFQNAQKLREEDPDRYIKNKRRKVVELTKCPDCGSSKINQVDNMCQGAKYFCVNCFREYNRYGEVVDPIK